MTTTWVRVAYGVALGVLLAVTVGYGVAVFNNGPKPPQPLGVSFSQLQGNATAAEANRITKSFDSYFQDDQNYRAAYPDYQRDLFLWYAGLGILIAAVGTALPAVVNYLRLGFVIGGVLLIGAGVWFSLQPLPQSVAAGANEVSLLMAGTPKTLDQTARLVRFTLAICGLLVFLFIGLWRLTEWTPSRATAPAGTAPGSAPLTAAPATVAPLQSIPAAAPATSGDSLRWARPEDRSEAEAAAANAAVILPPPSEPVRPSQAPSEQAPAPEPSAADTAPPPSGSLSDGGAQGAAPGSA